jgi:hypothetical protein
MYKFVTTETFEFTSGVSIFIRAPKAVVLSQRIAIPVSQVGILGAISDTILFV